MVRLYSLYDRVAEQYQPIWAANTDGEAVRKARAASKDMPYAEDFWLYYLGEFEESNGRLVQNDNPRRIVMDLSLDLTENAENGGKK